MTYCDDFPHEKCAIKVPIIITFILAELKEMGLKSGEAQYPVKDSPTWDEEN